MRAHYQELKNQFDIFIQSSVLFTVDPETKFVSYIDDQDIEKQGVAVRCKFSDTVAEIKNKVKEALQISSDFQMLEV